MSQLRTIVWFQLLLNDHCLHEPAERLVNLASALVRNADVQVVATFMLPGASCSWSARAFMYQ